MQTTATQETLAQALEIVNKRYKDNVEFNRGPEKQGRRQSFTLKVKSSKGPGARRGFTGRRMTSACWHVHGAFFALVWTLEPGALIIAGEKRMAGPADNWQDKNIGSAYNPLMFSDACDCD